VLYVYVVARLWAVEGCCRVHIDRVGVGLLGRLCAYGLSGEGLVLNVVGSRVVSMGTCGTGVRARVGGRVSRCVGIADSSLSLSLSLALMSRMGC
jgi:hypothetical protein